MCTIMHRWGFGVKMNGVQMVSNGNFVSMSYGISKQGQENRLGIQHKKKKCMQTNWNPTWICKIFWCSYSGTKMESYYAQKK